MAKKRSRKRRKKGTGSIIRVRRLGQLKNPSSMAGSFGAPMLGAATAAITTIGIRQYMTPTTPWQARLLEWAPWVGLAAGGLMALGLKQMKTVGKAGQWATVAGAAGVTLAMVGSEWVAKMRMSQGLAPHFTEGVGAIVPEYSMSGTPRAGTGAIVMEPQASRGYGAGPLGSYGETVNLGNINTQAFGTPGFQIG